MTNQNDERLETPLQFIRDNEAAYADAKAERIYLTEFRKTKKALLMNEAESKGRKTAQEREAYAYAHKDYQGLLDGLRVAIETEALIELGIERARLSIDIWRTKQANERNERNTYGANNGQ